MPPVRLFGTRSCCYQLDMRAFRTAAWLSLLALGCASAPETSGVSAAAPRAAWPEKVYYRHAEVDGKAIFYRESGAEHARTIVLLHGFPSSSHTYRELIPLLSGRFHVIAPDHVGSGFSARLEPGEGPYTFDILAKYVAGLIEKLRLQSFVLYMQDFGAPVGFRVALRMPDRLDGLVVQNANAYLDGLTPPRRAFFRRAHEDGSPVQIAALRQFVGDDAIRAKQYLRDVPGDKRQRMSPDAWTHDIALLKAPSDREAQVQLFQDYQTNIDAYPVWQAFLRKYEPPTLIVWGKHDPAFISAGAQAYLRDLPDAELHLIDAGHFAVEEQPVQVAQLVTRFMLRSSTGREQR